MEPPAYTLRALKLADIDLSGARHRFREPTSEEVEELAHDMALKGQLTPIKASPHPEGGDRHLLVAGERRCRAAILLRWAEIEALYYARMLTQEEHVSYSVMDNTSSREMNKLAKAVVIFELMKRLNVTAGAACSMVGFAQSEFSRMRPFLDALPETQEYILRSHLPTSVILAALKAPADKTLAVLKEAGEKSLTARDVTKLVATFKAPRKKTVTVPGIGKVVLEPGQDLGAALKALQKQLEGKK